MAAPFAQNVVIITGASDGIGRAMALQLAEQGAWLALAARGAGKLEQAAEECRARGGRAVAIPTDVGDPAQCRALIDRTVAEYGRIDTLVNNAGVSMWARFDQVTDLAPFETMMRVNYMGACGARTPPFPTSSAAAAASWGSAVSPGARGCPPAAGTRPASTPWPDSSTRCASSWRTKGSR